MKYSFVILILLSVVACAQQIKPDDALLFAASSNDVEGIKQALANGANIESTTVDGLTPLMHATFLDHLEAAQYLISQKADVNHRAVGGVTPLMLAAEIHPKIVTELIKAGADVNAKDDDGRTALMRTIHPDLKKQLKDAGAKEIKWVNPRAQIPTPTPSQSVAPSPAQASPAK